jgi:hypothetical protein
MNWIPEIIVGSEHDHSTPGNAKREKHLFCGFSPNGNLFQFLPFRDEEISEMLSQNYF